MGEVVKRAVGAICVAVVTAAVGGFLIALNVDAVRDVGGAVVFSSILATLVCIAAIGVNFLRSGEPNQRRNERMRRIGGRAFVVGFIAYCIAVVVSATAPAASGFRDVGLGVAGIVGVLMFLVALPVFVWGFVHAPAARTE